VAVKVRRPGVGPRLARDARALGWLLRLAEWLGVFRPRFTRMMRVEFERMLLEEVDFLREARNTELFRRDAAQSKLDFVTAPRVHFELCSHEILVTAFVDGVFLDKIIRALDTGDEAELQRIREQGIDLHEIAHRLIMAAHWALLEGLLFHADPHPANICVQPGNRIVFVDLASCGRLAGKYRRIWQRYHREFAAHNVQAMVRAAVAMLEPLPPIDLVSFSREIELIFWDWVYAINSDHSAWWEQASGMIWIKFADAARRYQVPMSAELVRIFRATFIYDTTVFRLWERIDMLAEFRSYQHQAGKRVRRRMRRAIRTRIAHGLTDTDYIDILDLWHMGQQIVGRVQHYLDIPAPDFAREIGKVSYAMLMILRLIALGLAIYIAGAAAFAGIDLLTGREVSLTSTLAAVARSRWFLVPLAGLALLLTAKVIRKLGEYVPL
jgi:ubiquinone biosynthesis protein